MIRPGMNCISAFLVSLALVASSAYGAGIDPTGKYDLVTPPTAHRHAGQGGGSGGLLVRLPALLHFSTLYGAVRKERG